MGVINKQLDNISSKQQIKACHCSADNNVADYAETQAFSHSLIVLSAVAVADKRLNTLTEFRLSLDLPQQSAVPTDTFSALREVHEYSAENGPRFHTATEMFDSLGI